jgi:bifunctional non-homologous end joining protein LigD
VLHPFPEPMLCRSAPLPRGPGWAFEVKWDGIRAIVETGDRVRVHSRRGWDMTAQVRDLAGLPPRLVLDGELVAFGPDGLPSFPLVCERVLHRRRRIPIVFMIFDVLQVGAEATVNLPYRERRHVLEQLDLRGNAWHTPAVYDDGDALYRLVCQRGLEGIVAKRRAQAYRPGEPAWIKVKSRAYWRWPLEREAAVRRRRSSRTAG